MSHPSHTVVHVLRNGPDGARRTGEASDKAGSDSARGDATGGDGAGGDQGLLVLRRFDAESLAGLGREALLSVLSDIERLSNRLAGYRAEALGALDALSRSGTAPDARPHLTLRDAAGVSERDARRMVRAAGKAREHVEVLDALSDGDINSAQAEALCDARVPDEVRGELLAAAGAEDTDATRRRVRQAEADHCAETSMERFERQRKARRAGWQRDHEGMLKLWAKFDPHTGAQIEAMLEPLRRELWSDDKQVRSGRRSPAQRDAYALAGIILTDTDTAAIDRLHARAHKHGHIADEPSRDEGLTATRQPSPSRRTTPPNNSAERSAARRNRAAPDSLSPAGSGQHGRPCCDPDPGLDAADRPQRRHNQPAPLPHEGPDPHDTAPVRLTGSWDPARRLPPAQISVLIGLDALRGQTDEMGLTDAGIELPPEIVRRLACDAEIIPMILGGSGGSADVGRTRRTIPPRLRRLLIARDKHCRWPGCAEPPSRCDAHHIRHWIDGGPTDLDNLVLLCHRHHHHLHQHGHKMVPRPDGTWTTVQTTQSTTRPQSTTRQPRGP